MNYGNADPMVGSILYSRKETEMTTIETIVEILSSPIIRGYAVKNDAEDAVQETFLTLADKLDSLPEDKEHLGKIAFLKVRDLNRKRFRNRTSSVESIPVEDNRPEDWEMKETERERLERLNSVMLNARHAQLLVDWAENRLENNSPEYHRAIRDIKRLRETLGK